MNFIKKISNFLLIYFLLTTPSFSLSNEEHKFIKDINYCLTTIYSRTMSDRHINKDVIIAMAAIESNYGRSRFAIEANNFFGIRTFDLKIPHIKPEKIKNPKFGIRKFKNFCGSVAYAVWTLNEHEAHKKFIESKNIHHLKNWAQDPDYSKKIESIIKYHLENSH